MRRSVRHGAGVVRARAWGLSQDSLISFLTHLPLFLPHPPAEAHAGDAAEDEAANAGPVTLSQLHIAMDILPVSGLALPTPGPRLAWI